jgi:hypothetical protein
MLLIKQHIHPAQLILYGIVFALVRDKIFNTTMPIYKNTSMTFTNGSTGTTVSNTSINTLSLNVTSIKDTSGSTGASGYILSSTGNGITWVTPFVSTATSNLNMNNNNITNTNTITTNTLNTTNITGNTGTVTFSNQVNFKMAPSTNSQIPALSNELASKYYVDNLASVSATSPSIFYLYPIPSISFAGSEYLSPRLIITSDAAVNLNTSLNASTSIAVMTGRSPLLNTTIFPSCIIQFNIYAWASAGINVAKYQFDASLTKDNAVNTILLGSSCFSPFIAFSGSILYPHYYTMTLMVENDIVCEPDHRLVITLNGFNNSASSTITLTTFFDGSFYSHIKILSNKSFFADMSYEYPSMVNNLTITGNKITDVSRINPTTSLTLGSTGCNINIGEYNETIRLTTTTLNINSPLTPLYTNVPALNQMGGVIRYTTFPQTTFGASPNSVIQTYTLPYAGVWICSATVGIKTLTTGTITMAYLHISNSSSSLYSGQRNFISHANPVGDGNYINVNRILVTTTTTNTITLNYSLIYTSGSYATSPNCEIQFVRIA